MRERAQKLGGTASVRSAEGEGTTIAVSLPRAGAARTPVADGDRLAEPGSAATGGG
jgi:signal transduction histidine kinase